MVFSSKKSLQSSYERYHASPTPNAKRKCLIPSPLVPCPSAGLLSTRFLPKKIHRLKLLDAEEDPEKKKKEKIQIANIETFGFLFDKHRKDEKTYEKKKRAEITKRLRMEDTMEDIEDLLPIDILIRSLEKQEQPERLPKYYKISPQMFNVLKVRRWSSRRIARRGKIRKPERGEFIPRTVPKGVLMDQIMAAEPLQTNGADPKSVGMMLATRLIQLEPELAWTMSVMQIIAHQRTILYQNEGTKWLQMFLPGGSDDDPKIPNVFRMFDNTDEGIPEELMIHKNAESALTTYQFRVLAKRSLIDKESDFDERYLLGELLGLSEEEVNCFLMKFRLEQAIFGKTEREIRQMIFSTFKTAVRAERPDSEEFKELLRNYHDRIVPMLNELFAKS